MKSRNQIKKPALKETFPASTSEKLQKVLARCGLASRREAETWISEKRVSVDGKIAELGCRVLPTAVIRVDGHIIDTKTALKQETRVLLYHKPAGEVCTRKDPEGRATVFQHLPRLLNGRWIMLGRLDFNTSGLLLFTNDGELANQLLHPSAEIEREYAVRVLGKVDPEIIKNLTEGVMLEDGEAKFDKVIDAGGEGANHWYHVILHEGRNREVRRLWESQGLRVSRLTRIRFGNITLPRLVKPGRYIELEKSEIGSLRFDLKKNRE